MNRFYLLLLAAAVSHAVAGPPKPAPAATLRRTSSGTSSIAPRSASFSITPRHVTAPPRLTSSCASPVSCTPAPCTQPPPTICLPPGAEAITVDGRPAFILGDRIYRESPHTGQWISHDRNVTYMQSVGGGGGYNLPAHTPTSRSTAQPSAPVPWMFQKGRTALDRPAYR